MLLSKPQKSPRSFVESSLLLWTKIGKENKGICCYENNICIPEHKFFEKILYFSYDFCIERQLFCKSTFVSGENNLLLGMYFLIPFTLKSPVCADSSGKFYQLLFPLGSTIFDNIKILSEILNVYSKKKLRLLWQRECSYKNNKKELQNQVRQIGNQSCWH